MNEIRHTSEPGIITLLYHRINKTDTDPWGICVSPENFEEQIQFLKNHFNIISANDLISGITSGNLPGNSVCITFDDGYADNYYHAKPILEKHDCPATFFIATAFINKRNFWWDELEMIFLQLKSLPASLLLHEDEEQTEYIIDEPELSEHQYLQHKNWLYYESAPTGRCAIFLNIWERLRNLHFRDIEKELASLKDWAHCSSDVFSARSPMNEIQLQQLSEQKLFTISMHTHTHADLKGKDTLLQAKEMVDSQRFLSRLHIESNLFAYPYGRFDASSVEAARQLHLDACFTTDAGKIYPHSNIFTLNRYQVFDWNLPAFKEQLNDWLYKSNTNATITAAHK